jgi:hypothetical protein
MRDGATYADGQVLHDVVDGYPVRLLDVLDSSEHLIVANALAGQTGHGHGPVAALQVVFPDPRGRWPWQPGSTVAGLPVLGAAPAGA